jgi:4-amino-4-deoxy-L-arabinose transferase-like glycosyltransferase
MDWMKHRIKEPSSWAAAGGILIGLGLLVGQPVIIAVGVIVGIGGFVLKEKNLI